jgi:hypothetical protein
MIPAALLLAFAVNANAQQPLRWRLEPGRQLGYNVVQDSKASVEGPFGELNVTMNQEMEITWEVLRLTDAGNAVIRQRFSSIKMKMTLPPPTGVLEYDPESKATETDKAAMFSPMVQALTQGEFEFTMSPRGEVTDVKIPDEVIAALKNSPGSTALKGLAIPDDLTTLILHGTLVLPEGAAQSPDEWSTQVEFSNPQGGKKVVEKTYRFEDTQEIDGVTYAVVRPTVKMNIEGNPQIAVTAQESSGEILFNIESGRVHSSDVNQSVTTEQDGVVTKINQSIKVNATAVMNEEG